MARILWQGDVIGVFGKRTYRVVYDERGTAVRENASGGTDAAGISVDVLSKDSMGAETWLQAFDGDKHALACAVRDLAHTKTPVLEPGHIVRLSDGRQAEIVPLAPWQPPAKESR